MQAVVLDSQELGFALRAFRAVMLAKGPLTPDEREHLMALQQAHGVEGDIDALRPIAPEEVAEAIKDPEKRTWVVQLAVVAAIVSGVTLAQCDAVQALDAALRVNEQSLTILRDVAHGRPRRARLAIVPRLYPRFFISAYKHGGLDYLRRTFGVFTNGYEDPETAWQFRKLGLLPKGTVGRAFWENFTSNRFAFPGERGGRMSERMIFHDFGHILSGYQTDAASEIFQGAFQAGFARTDGFVFLLFVLMQFQLGIRLTPVTQAQRGMLRPADALRALARGAACKVDLSDCWNHWDVVELKIEAWRELYGVPSLAPTDRTATDLQ